MSLNIICTSIIAIAVITIITTNYLDNFQENYTPIITKPINCSKNNNNCHYPYTNNKKNTPSNEDVYTYQYGNRKIMNPDEYLNMVRKLLNDLSTKKINVNKIPNNMVNEIKFLGDRQKITNDINNKINNLVKTKKYLQNNGSWKYEYFNVSDPTIYYYEVKNNLINGLPNKFNLFKIIYTLGNPLRSSYTSCIALITEINGILEIQYTTLTNDSQNKYQDKLNVIPQEALQFSFIDNIEKINFNKYGNPTDYSGLNYISEYKDSDINIKADIPKEFKDNNFNAQYLPPQFGNGVCKYPPMYENPYGKIQYYNNPPLY